MEQTMDYEIVELEEKLVAGVSARTNNTSPDMGKVIGSLWERFYKDGIYYGITEKKNQKALGIYTDYAGDEKGDYSVWVACELEKAAKIPEGAAVRTLPGGRYAKFIVHGDMVKAVAAFWERLWAMDLPRAFTCDFEEYQDERMEDAEIHMYISLK